MLLPKLESIYEKSQILKIKLIKWGTYSHKFHLNLPDGKMPPIRDDANDDGDGGDNGFRDIELRLLIGISFRGFF